MILPGHWPARVVQSFRGVVVMDVNRVGETQMRRDVDDLVRVWLGGNYLSMMRECVCLGENLAFCLL